MATQTLPQTPDTTPAYSFKAFWATLDGIHGHAERHTDGSCWFVADDGSTVLLHQVDRPNLHLFGEISLCALQAMVDHLHGNIYEQVIWRNTEHPRTVAAA